MEETVLLENYTNATNDLYLNESLTHTPHFLIYFLTLTNILSFAANLLAIVAICLAKKLRKSLSSVYTFSLCLLDIVASTTVLPKSTALIASGKWVWHDSLCQFNGVFNAFLIFAVILTICARELEKYYCIKYPMHHASRMTVRTAFISVVVAWMSALCLATFPLLLWNGYMYRPKSLQCTYLWQQQKPNIIFGTFVTFFFLFAPLILMLHINCTMYRIAKRAMRQVEPIVTDGSKVAKTRVRLSIIVARTHGESSRKQPGSPELTTSTFSRNMSQPIELKQTKACGSMNPDCHFNLHREAISRLQELQRTTAKQSESISVSGSIMRDSLVRPGTNYKALKSLILPFVYFTVIWGSYFVTHFTWLIGIFKKYYLMETICTLIVYVSYLLNPFVYGFLYKSFRDECFGMMQEHMCVSRNSSSLSPPPPACENIMEFLQRTSYANQGQTMETNRHSVEERGFLRPSVIVCQEGMPDVDL